MNITELIKNHIRSHENFVDKVNVINDLRQLIHEESPFKNEPVDFVKWVISDDVVANDYNPNKVAPPEMQLLEVSIMNDGYTQPVVTFPVDGKNEVVDGFHRTRVCKESITVNKRVNGFIPTVIIRKEVQGKKERIASTIRHNRARGKHQVSAMSEIVIELKNRNWTNKRISRELGMDEDEILRLCQISGLEDLFKDKDFKKAWVSNNDNLDLFEGIDDSITEEDYSLTKIPNEDDKDRIFHTYDKWEAVSYGFYDLKHKKYTKKQCEWMYKSMMCDLQLFNDVLDKVISEWKYSCEHNLTNKSMNRIAWLGQCAMAYKYNVPSIYCSGWQLLTKEEQDAANEVALNALNTWLVRNNLEKVSMDQALLVNRQVELY